MIRYLLLSLFLTYPLFSFEKVVIWGHKLHSHTHSYIHNAFYRAFASLGYPTYWFDDADNTSEFDFSDALFLTEGQVCEKIPLRDDGKYILHNCKDPKFSPLFAKGQALILQVYTDDVLSRPEAVKIAPCIYFDLKGKLLYMPWATDLLPDEIEKQKLRLPSIVKSKTIHWIGTVGGGRFGNDTELNPFIKEARKKGFPFQPASGCEVDKNIELIAKSYIAPTIVGAWQKEKGYIPCRIFKNISYGAMGVTNSERVYELFEGKIVYSPNTKELFRLALKRLETWSLEKDQYPLMDFVKEHHTYINRIGTLLDALEQVERHTP